MNLLDYLPADFLARISLPKVIYTPIGAGVQVVAPADPNRVLLVFTTSQSVSGIFIGVDPQVDNTTHPGIILSGSVAPPVFSYWFHGPIVCAPWYCFGFGAGPTVAVITQSLLPSVQLGNEVPLPVQLPPQPAIRRASGPLASLWSRLTGR